MDHISSLHNVRGKKHKNINIKHAIITKVNLASTNLHTPDFKPSSTKTAAKLFPKIQILKSGYTKINILQ